MRAGLEVLLDDPRRWLGDARVGLVCNHTAVDRKLEHAIELLQGANVDLVRLFAPEHGVRATAQDMEGCDERIDPVSGLPVVSLYGDDAASLHPDPATLEDLDVVLFDIQDIGARYYTYQATLGFVMQVAGRLGKKVIVLDRPNPINGVTVEGGRVEPGFESFVGAFPLAIRHGMTMAEMARWFVAHCGVECDLAWVPCEGWAREMWFDQTGLPWVYPSPNMPTLETATIYPGMCLLEATRFSEGRGTTRPFHLVGGPGVDPLELTAHARLAAQEEGLRGVAFRPAAFRPGFQKHAGVNCTGIEVHVTNRDELNATLLGMVVLEALWRCAPEQFAWREEAYEFVDDVPAIDLLTGSPAFRLALEGGSPVHEVLDAWEDERLEFLESRRSCLLYD